MEKKSKVLTVILAVIAALAVCVALWALFFRAPAPVLLPPDEVPTADENAVPTDDGDGEKLEQPTGGGAVNITYSNEVTISLSEGSASLLFSNPSRSNQSMVLDLVVQDTTVLRSGALFPGNQLETLPLLDTARLSPGRYDGKFQVYFYDLDTKDKALLNTEIPVSITVVE